MIFLMSTFHRKSFHSVMLTVIYQNDTKLKVFNELVLKNWPIDGKYCDTTRHLKLRLRNILKVKSYTFFFGKEHTFLPLLVSSWNPNQCLYVISPIFVSRISNLPILRILILCNDYVISNVILIYHNIIK